MAIPLKELEARLQVREPIPIGRRFWVRVSFENERVMKYVKDDLLICRLSDADGFFRVIDWKGTAPTLLLHLECIPEPPYTFPKGNIITLEFVTEPPKKP